MEGHFATAGTKITLTSVMSHEGKIGPLWNTQALIVTYAIRPAVVINRDCILYNPGWLYLLPACHESISVTNLGWRRESEGKVTPSVFLIISWCGWGQVWKLVWLYSESIIISPCTPSPTLLCFSSLLDVVLHLPCSSRSSVSSLSFALYSSRSLFIKILPQHLDNEIYLNGSSSSQELRGVGGVSIRVDSAGNRLQ